MSDHVIDVRSSVVDTAGELAARFTQDIPDSFVDELKTIRKESDAAPIGDLLHAARIPVWKVEEWMAQGFNIYSPAVTGVEIIARLERDGLDFFKVTSRRI